MRGKIFVISAPSGTGKTTVVKKLLCEMPDLKLAVSYTTRAPRRGETDGVDYHFVKKDRFKSMINSGEFIEWAEVHGQLYGTPKKEIEKDFKNGVGILLDIDTCGAAKVKGVYPDAVLIFLLPPSFEELAKRLKGRKTDSTDDVEQRIEHAREELVKRHEYDYQVVNEDIDEACEEIMEIIEHYQE